MAVSDQDSGSRVSAVSWTSDSNLWLAEEFDDTHLVFYRPSAETHFLNFLSYGALSSLSIRQASAKELWRNLKEEFSLNDLEFPLSLMESVVQQLDEAGLISPVPVDACNR